jgi:hypothetical protein
LRLSIDPARAGSFGFGCEIGMIRGILIVDAADQRAVATPIPAVRIGRPDVPAEPAAIEVEATQVAERRGGGHRT